jgi:hypothetical protein
VRYAVPLRLGDDLTASRSLEFETEPGAEYRFFAE